MSALERTKSVLVTVPNQHWLHKAVVHRLLLLQLDSRYKLTIEMPSHRPYVDNLQACVDMFVTGPYDFWLSMDDDNPPVENPLDLVELDKDILGFPTPVWHYVGKPKERPVYLNCYKDVPGNEAYREYLPHEGLQRVDAIGTGCFLIARRVFMHPELRYGAFQRLWRNGRVHKGNDIAFSERARGAGFETWAHYDYYCSHKCELDLIEVIRAFGYTRPESKDADE